MAILRPDEYRHQNSSLAIVDAANVRGGGLRVADLNALYALASAPDKLKEGVTVAYVVSEAAAYRLTNLLDAGEAAGWTQEGGDPRLSDLAEAPILYYHQYPSDDTTYFAGFYDLSDALRAASDYGSLTVRWLDQWPIANTLGPGGENDPDQALALNGVQLDFQPGAEASLQCHLQVGQLNLRGGAITSQNYRQLRVGSGNLGQGTINGVELVVSGRLVLDNRHFEQPANNPVTRNIITGTGTVVLRGGTRFATGLSIASSITVVDERVGGSSGGSTTQTVVFAAAYRQPDFNSGKDYMSPGAPTYAFSVFDLSQTTGDASLWDESTNSFIPPVSGSYFVYTKARPFDAGYGAVPTAPGTRWFVALIQNGQPVGLAEAGTGTTNSNGSAPNPELLHLTAGQSYQLGVYSEALVRYVSAELYIELKVPDPSTPPPTPAPAPTNVSSDYTGSTSFTPTAGTTATDYEYQVS